MEDEDRVLPWSSVMPLTVTVISLSLQFTPVRSTTAWLASSSSTLKEETCPQLEVALPTDARLVL